MPTFFNFRPPDLSLKERERELEILFILSVGCHIFVEADKIVSRYKTGK